MDVFEMVTITKNDEAVSPVISVILMVAITVILAAVITAFVFGMAGNISKTESPSGSVGSGRVTFDVVEKSVTNYLTVGAFTNEKTVEWYLVEDFKEWSRIEIGKRYSCNAVRISFGIVNRVLSNCTEIQP
jgi:flagellin-like protein